MTEWVVLSLDEKMAKRHGMPAQVPMPKDKFEALGTAGLTHETAGKWIAEFMGEAGPAFRQKAPAEAKRYEAYLAKMKFWQDAQKAFGRRDFAKAISLLTLVTNVDKEDYSAKQNLATAHAAAGNPEAATKLFAQIEDVWEGVADYHVAYANALVVNGNHEEATEQFVRALEADAECRPAMDGLVTLGFLVKIYEDPLDAKSLIFVRRDSLKEYLQAQWDESSGDVDHFLRIAAYHESEERHDVALAAAERALGLDPNNEAAAITRAASLRRLGRPADAQAALRQFAAGHAASPSVLAQLALGEFEARRADEGQQLVQEALGVDAGHMTALQLKFFGDLATPPLEKVAAALPQLEQYVEQHPLIAGPMRLLGRLRTLTNHEEAALRALQGALALTPDDDDLRVEYWNTLLRFGHHQAVADQAQALEHFAQRDWRLRWSEADAYLALGKKAEARTAFTALNADESLHVAVRARAKRAVQGLGA